MRVINTAQPELIKEIKESLERPAYNAGHAFVWLCKSAGVATLTYNLSGRLYLSKSGYLLLSVPNALVLGAFDALDEHGAELPPNPFGGNFDAHITVMRPEEVDKIGGDKISERGHNFHYTLGPVKEVNPEGWAEMSKCWFIEVKSPELQNLRKSYGLSPTPKDGEHPFHITIAVRRKNVLRDNEVKKSAGVIDKVKSIVNKFDLEGINISVSEKPKQVWMDIMDWGDEDTGKKLQSAIEKITGKDSVQVTNERSAPHDWKSIIKSGGLFDHLVLAADDAKGQKKHVRVLLPYEKDQYLLQKAKMGAGKYRVPGGKIEPGETPHEAAVRELNEELGIPHSLSEKHLEYIGPDHRPDYAHQHYFILRKHGVNPGKYVASNDPNEIVELEAKDAKGDHYWGPDLDIMLNHRKKEAGVIPWSFLPGGRKNVDNPRLSETEFGQGSEGNSGILGPQINEVDEPHFRVVGLIDGKPVALTEIESQLAGDDERRNKKPDDSWLPASTSKGESYWTAHGLKRYIDSGLFDWHRGIADSDLAVLIAKKLKNPKYSDEYQRVVDPTENQADDTYFIDRNRTKPLTAGEIIERYTPRHAAAVGAAAVPV